MRKISANFKKGAIVLGTILAFTACSKDDGDSPTPVVPIGRDLQVAYSSGSGSLTQVYLQGISDPTTGEVAISNGFNMGESRAPRIWLSTDGKYVYNLHYTIGTIQKYEYLGGDNYNKLKDLDASITLGHTAIRFTKITDEIASAHYISSTPIIEGEGANAQYKKHKITASIGILDLETITFRTGSVNKEIDVVLPDGLAEEGYNITRIDAPVISGSKIYYGAAVSKYDPNTARNTATDKTMTLVLDYPALTNATVIYRDDVVGATNGYRTPTQWVNEQGEILQLVSNSSTNEVHIVKIVNGAYTSYKYSLNTALGGKNTRSNGFFYAGNGIAYIPYEKRDEAQIQIGVNPQGEPTYSAEWGLARMDLNGTTAVDLETPSNLWLTQYQTAITINGKFYIALGSVGGEGNIYIFDVNSTSPQGTLGAKMKSGADQYPLGVY